MIKDLPIIKCPVCGQEYLPSELFLPEAVFGKQYDITKSDSGEIKFYLGDDPELDEEYICDGCGSKLKVHMNMTFNVEANKEENYSEEYITKINKPKKIKLEENDLF